MKILQIFYDRSGKFSQGRVLTFIAAMLAFMLITVAAFSDGVAFGDVFSSVIILLGYSLGQKTFQNMTEMGLDKLKK